MDAKEAKRILMSDADFSGVGEKAEKTAEALCVAIEALEKMIPRKPVDAYLCRLDFEDEKTMLGTCPNCGITIAEPFEYEDYFCISCGQHIDWEVE